MKEDKTQHWKNSQLGDLAEYINGRAFKPTEWRKTGLPIVRIQNLNNDSIEYNYTTGSYEDRYVVKKGDLLFAWAASIGVYIWKKDKAWLNQHIFKVIPKPFIDKLYLYYLLGTLIDRFYSESHGSGMVHITKNKFTQILVKYPPLTEQRAIVAKLETLLSELDNAVATLKQAKEQIKTYRQAVLKAAFTGKLTEEWRKQKSEDLIWEELTTRNLFEFITSGSRGWARYYADQGALFIRIGNLDHGTIDLDLNNKQHVNPPIGAEGTRTKVIADDILISITADVGMVALIPENFEESYINQHIALARPDKCKIHPRYLAWYLTSPVGQKQFQDLRKGATKVGLGLDDIKAIIVRVPKIEEQLLIINIIESRFSTADQLEQTIDDSLIKTEALKQSLLKQAFEGKLLTEQELEQTRQAPDWEPAEKLLERISSTKKRS